jgi:hypothetical protein
MAIINSLFHNLHLCITDDYYPFFITYLALNFFGIDIDNLCAPKTFGKKNLPIGY